MTIINMLREKLDDRLWPSMDVNMRIRTYIEYSLSPIEKTSWHFAHHPFNNMQLWRLLDITDKYYLRSQNHE